MAHRATPGPYTGYEQTGLPAEDAELTHVVPGSPGGEYLRNRARAESTQRSRGLDMAVARVNPARSERVSGST